MWILFKFSECKILILKKQQWLKETMHFIQINHRNDKILSDFPSAKYKSPQKFLYICCLCRMVDVLVLVMWQKHLVSTLVMSCDYDVIRCWS